MSNTKSQYELFHEWLNNCPTRIEDYEDNIDSVTIRFELPSDDNEEDNEVAESIKNSSEIAPERVTQAPKIKSNKVTYEMEHTSEGC